MKNTTKIAFIILLCFTGMHYLKAQTRVIAHRGFWNTENSAENSISALINAQNLGIYGSEFDVWITSDDIAVINHDKDIDKMVIEKTPYAKLKDCKLKNGEKLPTLDEYLTAGAKDKNTKLILEIKPHSTKEKEKKAVKVILDMVGEKKLWDQVEFISFSLNICKEIQRLKPEAMILYLEGDLSPAQVKELGLSGIDYSYKVYLKEKSWLEEAKEIGLITNVWTVDNVHMMKSFISRGIDFITTNQPDTFLEVTKEDNPD